MRKQTQKRLARIEAKHKFNAIHKPIVACIGTGIAKTGFDKTIRAKQSKGFKSSSIPTCL